MTHYILYGTLKSSNTCQLFSLQMSMTRLGLGLQKPTNHLFLIEFYAWYCLASFNSKKYEILFTQSNSQCGIKVSFPHATCNFCPLPILVDCFSLRTLAKLSIHQSCARLVIHIGFYMVPHRKVWHNKICDKRNAVLIYQRIIILKCKW